MLTIDTVHIITMNSKGEREGEGEGESYNQTTKRGLCGDGSLDHAIIKGKE